MISVRLNIWPSDSCLYIISIANLVANTVLKYVLFTISFTVNKSKSNKLL